LELFRYIFIRPHIRRGDPADAKDIFINHRRKEGGVYNIYASHIGNGLAVGDFNGDGTEDLSFSYRYRGRGYAVVLLGSLTYPGVPAGTDIQVHEGADFDPDVQIDLSPGGWEEASLSYSNLNGKEGEDLVIGLPFATGYEVWRKKVGQADIFFGRAIPTDITLTRSDANVTTFGVDSSDNWGKLTMGADMDNDGFDELIITAPGGDGVDNLEPNCGEAHMFDLDGTVPGTLTFQDSVRAFKGRTQDSGAFASMATSEMVIDGMEEIIISSPFEEVDLGPSMGRGLVSIISLKSSFDASFVGQFNASKFGSVMVVADFDQVTGAVQAKICPLGQVNQCEQASTRVLCFPLALLGDLVGGFALATVRSLRCRHDVIHSARLTASSSNATSQLIRW